MSDNESKEGGLPYWAYPIIFFIIIPLILGIYSWATFDPSKSGSSGSSSYGDMMSDDLGQLER